MVKEALLRFCMLHLQFTLTEYGIITNRRPWNKVLSLFERKMEYDAWSQCNAIGTFRLRGRQCLRQPVMHVKVVNYSC